MFPLVANYYLNSWFHCKQLEHSVHVNQSLTSFAIHTAKKIERKRQLKQKAIDHDLYNHIYNRNNHRKKTKIVRVHTCKIDYLS